MITWRACRESKSWLLTGQYACNVGRNLEEYSSRNRTMILSISDIHCSWVSFATSSFYKMSQAGKVELVKPSTSSVVLKTLKSRTPSSLLVVTSIGVSRSLLPSPPSEKLHCPCNETYRLELPRSAPLSAFSLLLIFCYMFVLLFWDCTVRRYSFQHLASSNLAIPRQILKMALSSKKMQLNFFDAACTGSHTAIGQ
ncbi:uncharacterized protein LY89DRAFT_322600 [Mollisia scopiformis]|uniref:Uncharacterized protein n=1 Tax=Mollisia scopiformis TaxID=149040 RepID=A0A132B8C9_MOLSC|nr:uncharacterized protein LY89DRAFT_322600 [Mollisia scopiformis]KUJ08655.1 hypothetical protein LY89DRAFT_322600 [Mollisia scopiformis]